MNVHRSRIDILQIGSFQREDACIRTIELRVFADEARSMISGIKIFALARADVDLVVAGRSIE